MDIAIYTFSIMQMKACLHTNMNDSYSSNCMWYTRLQSVQ